MIVKLNLQLKPTGVRQLEIYEAINEYLKRKQKETQRTEEGKPISIENLMITIKELCDIPEMDDILDQIDKDSLKRYIYKMKQKGYLKEVD
ncbi:MAG: hypothetical protein PVF58_14090 [Candidatus Methanofastidiosia archaeon]|jgi:hypothetical protein